MRMFMLLLVFPLFTQAQRGELTRNDSLLIDAVRSHKHMPVEELGIENVFVRAAGESTIFKFWGNVDDGFIFPPAIALDRDGSIIVLGATKEMDKKEITLHALKYYGYIDEE